MENNFRDFDFRPKTPPISNNVRFVNFYFSYFEGTDETDRILAQ